MTVEQYFLSEDGAAPPDRWHLAFPAGKSYDVQEISQTPSHDWAGLVWLSSDRPNWLHRVRQLRQLQPSLPLVLMSTAPDSREGLLALDAGVRGYTHAYAVPELLREVAVVVQHGGLWVGPELLQRLVASTAAAIAKQRTTAMPSAASDCWTMLTARECQVAQAVSAGQSNKEIATKMFISERTVKAHLGAIFDKLGVRDRLQLVVRLAAAPAPAPDPNASQNSTVNGQ